MIDWDDIDTVFLDMDGTLLDLNFDNRFWLEFVPQHYAQRHGLSEGEANLILLPKFKAMEGRLEWYCLDYWSAQLDLDLPALKQEISGLITVLPHVTEFLDAVRAIGKCLVLVTNAHPMSLGLKMDKTHLRVFFDAIVSSHEHGKPKEDPSFWGGLRNVQAFSCERTLLVDDSLPVLRSARTFGIRHLVAVRKHDSTRPARLISEFMAVDDFREIMPG